MLEIDKEGLIWFKEGFKDERRRNVVVIGVELWFSMEKQHVKLSSLFDAMLSISILSCSSKNQQADREEKGPYHVPPLSA